MKNTKNIKGKNVKIIGYTSGVFDLFHVGHVNVLRSAKSMCDHLIVGVSTDELVYEYKKRLPVIPFLERCEILRAIHYVDTVVSQEKMDKLETCRKLKVDSMFVGDDWYGTPKWETIEAQLAEIGVKIIYLPYTRGTSSTKVNTILENFRMEE